MTDLFSQFKPHTKSPTALWTLAPGIPPPPDTRGGRGGRGLGLVSKALSLQCSEWTSASADAGAGAGAGCSSTEAGQKTWDVGRPRMGNGSQCQVGPNRDPRTDIEVESGASRLNWHRHRESAFGSWSDSLPRHCGFHHEGLDLEALPDCRLCAAYVYSGALQRPEPGHLVVGLILNSTRDVADPAIKVRVWSTSFTSRTSGHINKSILRVSSQTKSINYETRVKAGFGRREHEQLRVMG
ncbi:uncharacterized protein BJX67DRAFT_183647 [Aspergillus lucknowensis]|uniref:Uncharacterized protein n=1 Tax=Aspergillus lucknowensis TaxID=176173 RepID=A0ABR4LLG8_9EURO